MNEVVIAILTFILGFLGGFWICLYLVGKNIGNVISGYLAKKVADELDKVQDETTIKPNTILPSNGNPPPPPPGGKS